MQLGTPAARCNGRIRWLVVVPAIPRHSREGGNPDEHREILRPRCLAINIALTGLLPPQE